MRIGILGGTFNPIHYGHIRMAKRAMREFSLDCCHFIVANDPPHKQVANNVPAALRYDMAMYALSEVEQNQSTRLIADNIEIERGGVSYTVDTLKALSDKFPDDELFLIVGADMLDDLPSWREPEEIFKMAEIIAVSRKGIQGCHNIASARDLKEAGRRLNKKAEDIKSLYSARIHTASFPTPNISSGMIRERVHDARPVSEYVTFTTEMIIYQNGLYQPDNVNSIIAELKKKLNRKRFLHSVSAMREAITLADLFHADSEKCRIAALLHDCAKFNGIDYIGAAEAAGIEIDGYEKEAPALLHAKLGAYEAEHRYGVSDPEVLKAIEKHTLCTMDMSDLDKIVYIADKIEALRDFPGVEGLRSAVRRDLNKGFLACLDFNVAYMKNHNAFIHPATLEVHSALCKDM